jgi:hypothetical protein
MESLKVVKVINDDLRREKVYLRKKGEDVIEKALSHKYYKREPKAGGGYKYYYTKEQYEKAKGKSGEEVKKEVGSIVEHNGKKYKKQSNGKWVEVSEMGMTKHEHKREIVEKQVGQGKSVMRSGKRNVTVDKKIQELSDIESKLSDKEHSDEEIGLSKKKDTSEKDFMTAQDTKNFLKKRGLREGTKDFKEAFDRIQKEIQEQKKDTSEIEIGQTYHSSAPEGGEEITFKVTSIKDGKYTIETSNKEGRKNTHTLDEKSMKELVKESKLKQEPK